MVMHMSVESLKSQAKVEAFMNPVQAYMRARDLLVGADLTLTWAKNNKCGEVPKELEDGLRKAIEEAIEISRKPFMDAVLEIPNFYAKVVELNVKINDTVRDLCKNIISK